MLTLYVYDADTKIVVAKITGESNAACESKASDLNYDDTDRYGWTYSPAFGFTDGLFDADVAVIHV